MQGLVHVDGARAGQLGAQDRGHQRATPHAVGDDAVEQGVIGVLGVQMGRIGVAGDSGKGHDVGL
jgi:hypothetical protein